MIDPSDLALIKESQLFDAEWYLSQYPEVTYLDMSPEEHYLTFGARLGRDPSPLFSTKMYLSSNPDANEAEGNALLHFLKSRLLNGRGRTGVGQGIASEGLQQERTRESESANFNLTYRDDVKFRPGFRRLIRATRQQIISETVSGDYETIANLIDLPQYLLRYGDLVRASVNPVAHYLNNGRREGRRLWPGFDPKWYLANNAGARESGLDPHVHYLERGHAEGLPMSAWTLGSKLFGDYCRSFGLEAEQIDAARREYQTSLRARLDRGELAEMVSKATEIEPLIGQGWAAAMEAGVSPLRSEVVLRVMTAMRAMHDEAQFRRAKAVVLIPWCHLGGAARVAGYLASALSEIYGRGDDIVVVRTETSELDYPEWFPSNARHVDLASAAEGLPEEWKLRLLIEFVRSLRPTAVFNVNSRSFWEALLIWGRPLSKATDIYSYMFCADVDIYGNSVGYPIRRFHQTFAHHRAILVDSDYLKNDLVRRFNLHEAGQRKVVKMATPLEAIHSVAMTPGNGERRRQIFWAGRFDRQKRVDLVYRIATMLPDLEFRMWGKPVLDRSSEKLRVPPNVRHEGIYSAFSDLPLHECDAWLYTSEWDGVPNILLDIATTGVPIVGTAVGGTSEVLHEDASWPIRVEDVDGYVNAIRSILSDPVAARERALRLRGRIQERTADRYREALSRAMEV
ncbi:MAG: glycosyltransferase family 4 protein [Rhizobiaceae bacterium]|nr:MAG: glycosyltransferase family 4 protein [Rhizobiaceae bacterium]CAG0972135.1 hypothetical protein RHIZO_01275 [Rhizobiaceae bacterium]